MAFSASIFSFYSFAVAAVLLVGTAAARPATSAVVARGTNATAAAANATVMARGGRSLPLSTATTEEEEQHWVVVDVVSCQASAGCYLVCSYGDALPSSSSSGAASGEITPAAIGSPLPRGLTEFERCGDQR
uniref:Uncharacterized protein n=1 Tax=Oryza nivara TaxID=4536 RepID=A0A0E0GJF2_ORYNI